MATKQDTYTFHKPVWYRFKRNRVVVGAIDEQREANLVIMDSLNKHNNGFKYILTVIHVLTTRTDQHKNWRKPCQSV